MSALVSGHEIGRRLGVDRRSLAVGHPHRRQTLHRRGNQRGQQLDSAIGVGLVNLALSIVPLLIILMVTHFPIYTTWFFLPVAVAIETLFAAGVGLWLFTFASRFSDVREMYVVIVQTWFFLTPIVYHPAIVPPKFRFALWLNPVYYLVQTFRKPVYDGVLPSVALVAVSSALSLVVFVSGWIYFAKRAERFAFHS